MYIVPLAIISVFTAACMLGHALFLSGGVNGGKNQRLLPNRNVFKVHSIGGSVTVTV